MSAFEVRADICLSQALNFFDKKIRFTRRQKTADQFDVGGTTG